MNDPILGKSKASIFAKMLILEPENNFPNGIEPDSAILYIPMVDGLNFYGNQLTKQRLQIFQLELLHIQFLQKIQVIVHGP